MFERIRRMLVKEFIQIFRDPRMKAVIFVMPVVQLMVFGYAVTTDVRNVSLGVHDLDNRLKDIMDALQGRAGGGKALRTLDPVIPNDRQVFKVTIEKMPPPRQSRGMGHLVIRRYKMVSREVAGAEATGVTDQPLAN